ncbi:GntR family transcriptional regulator [Corynebacterium casei]|uniref:GntR family transcriptional regulator n=1 Tax=Corynebacterium casei TaxID=160386 RepID=UPI00264A1321|nr:GntR family transcriptional regulator [Corynebacterium casei]MDN5841224.1 GntR family transcriptional regulator [Corynebacterium casei]
MALGKLGGQARVSDRAFEALYMAIMQGDLEAGRRLQVRELAESLGTSMMPVREALNRLEEFGLVETSPYRGAVVKTFTQDELLEIYSVRTVLESEAVKAGIAHVDEQCVEALNVQLQHIRTALEVKDSAGFLDAEEALLSCVFELSGNSTLMGFIRTLWARSRYYKMVGVKDIFEKDNVALLVDEATQFVAGATAKDEQMTLDALLVSLQRAEDGIQAEFRRN